MAEEITARDEGFEAPAMRAVLALLADEREARIVNNSDARSTEVLLADAGFSIGEIASLLGKKYETVRSTLRRSKDK
jgi:DNA-directed RNA polymerase specialized sigma24 family protein